MDVYRDMCRCVGVCVCMCESTWVRQYVRVPRPHVCVCVRVSYACVRVLVELVLVASVSRAREGQLFSKKGKREGQLFSLACVDKPSTANPRPQTLRFRVWGSGVDKTSTPNPRP
jgi:hypothetical protein